MPKDLATQQDCKLKHVGSTTKRHWWLHSYILTTTYITLINIDRKLIESHARRSSLQLQRLPSRGLEECSYSFFVSLLLNQNPHFFLDFHCFLSDVAAAPKQPACTHTPNTVLRLGGFSHFCILTLERVQLSDVQRKKRIFLFHTCGIISNFFPVSVKLSVIQIKSGFGCENST